MLIKLKAPESELEFDWPLIWCKYSRTLLVMLDMQLDDDDNVLCLEIPNCSERDLSTFISLMSQLVSYQENYDIVTINYINHLADQGSQPTILKPLWVTSFQKHGSPLIANLLNISLFLDIEALTNLLHDCQIRPLQPLSPSQMTRPEVLNEINLLC